MCSSLLLILLPVLVDVTHIMLTFMLGMMPLLSCVILTLFALMRCADLYVIIIRYTSSALEGSKRCVLCIELMKVGEFCMPIHDGISFLF